MAIASIWEGSKAVPERKVSNFFFLLGMRSDFKETSQSDPLPPEVLEHFSESSETGARETGAGGLTASNGADAGPLFSCELRFS
jgi:hypothetical protein